MTLTELTQQVHNAAIRLDDIKPGWEKLIDIDRLEMSSCVRCIVGQLFRSPQGTHVSWSNQVRRIMDRPYKSIHGSCRFGFDANVFAAIITTPMWLKEIANRLAKV